MIQFDQSIVDKFKVILDDRAPAGRQKEQVVQEYLEDNTVLIPTPNILHHGLHFELILSKLPIGTEFITDYVYITKTSDVWRITLVELESPDKKIFSSNLKTATFSAEFNAAVGQVRSWKLFLEDNKKEFVRRIEPLLQPLSMRCNPIELNYQLIIGRSDEKNRTVQRKQAFRAHINDLGIGIMTFDQVISRYQNERSGVKLVARLNGSQFRLTHMPFSPKVILAYLGPEHLTLTADQIGLLKADGYEMDKWVQGELLTSNWKYAASTAADDLANLDLVAGRRER